MDPSHVNADPNMDPSLNPGQDLTLNFIEEDFVLPLKRGKIKFIGSGR